MNSWQQVDANWAWSQYEPSQDKPFDRELAAHLFRRAGFGANTSELDEAVAAGPAETISRMLQVGDESPALKQEADELAHSVLATNNARNLSAWWLYRMLHTPQPLVEKMTLFWHGHFATSADKVTETSLMYEQNQLFRRLALGSFSTLALEVSRDPAMLIYLDSAANRKAHPNENYARELMELFCLGEGNYSEKDVQELARCFTGWEIKRDKFRFNRYQHDEGMKSILGQQGAFAGEEAVSVVVAQPAAPKFIVQKLIRYFVSDEAAPADKLIEPLVREFQDSGLIVGTLVERILRSNLFFSDLSIGQKIKSPVDLLVGFLRSLEGSTNVYKLAEDLAELGHALFFPPNVKGWDGGRAWINSSTLLARANAFYRLIHDSNTRFSQTGLGEYLLRGKESTSAGVIARMEELVFALALPQSLRDPLAAIVPDSTSPSDGRWADLVHAMCTLPEFQFG